MEESEQLIPLIHLGREERFIEYKESLPWDDLKFKITKTAMGMANIRDGGTIIIGITQTGSEFLRNGINEEHMATYDVDEILAFINRFANNTIGTTIAFATCVPRHLGAGAAFLERYDEAREHYKEAIRVCTEMKFRPELALTRLQLAELLLEHYPEEKKEALEHLDFAIKEFREMKMKPSLERALR